MEYRTNLCSFLLILKLHGYLVNLGMKLDKKKRKSSKAHTKRTKLKTCFLSK